MALRLYNTLSGKVEEFQPIQDKQVRMYACGPTVYDYGHIGNFRTFVAVDILHRFLRQSGYGVRHVMNITDVDDKIIRNSTQAGVPLKQFTSKYEKAFLEDTGALNIEQPELVRATDHIPEMADFIAKLVEKGFAYRTDDGSYYFRIAKFPDYGKLSKKDFAGMEDGARVDVDEYEKDSARDFALGSSEARRDFVGHARLVPGDRGGTLSARSCRWRNSATVSICMREGGADFPASRKRDRAVRIGYRQAFCEVLVSCTVSAGRRREDVQEPGQFLYPARSGA